MHADKKLFAQLTWRECLRDMSLLTEVLIAIFKQELHVDASPASLLQILTAFIFKVTRLSCDLRPDTPSRRTTRR